VFPILTGHQRELKCAGPPEISLVAVIRTTANHDLYRVVVSPLVGASEDLRPLLART
jgi:hypothetical protein